jgi:phosphoenolpyruvate---glycerone phosphotransferase subunit DhaL
MEEIVTVVISASTLVAVLKDAAVRWASHSEELRQLDAIIGDGDMGVTVELGAKAITNYLASSVEEDIGKQLMKCGLQINKFSPSTFGTLLASAFMEAGKAVLGKKEIEFKDLALMGRQAVEGIKKRGKAEVGDKTMLDALVPAVDSFQQGISNGLSNKEALEKAINAAQNGAAETKKMKAKFSRASYRPDGGIGVQDPGATAMYYLIEAFGQSLTTQKL